MNYQPIGGVIAAGNDAIAEAGETVFRMGGNAFDVAVAAVWATFIAEPQATSAGGGGFLNAYTSAGKSTLFDFFVQTPQKKRASDELNFYPVTINFGDNTQIFHGGLGSMAVPGNVAGLFHIQEKLGKLPMSEVLKPAIGLAKKGVEITPYFRWALGMIGPIMSSLPSGRKLLEPHGKPLEVGDRFASAEMADALEALSREGARLFYEGDFALKAVSDCVEHGGHLSMDDFRDFKVFERQPLRLPYREYELLTNPPPSAGGSLVAFLLKLLEQKDIGPMGFGSPEYLNGLINGMQRTSLARQETLDPHLYAPNVIDRFFAGEFLKQHRHSLAQQTDFWGSTTHVSVADNEGNLASVTTSVGAGCGYVIPGTGFMMNNMLGESDLNPNGFHQWQENQRITSMMAPTLLLKDKKPRLALGTGGSNRIRSSIAQVILNVVDFGMLPDEAIQAPRLHWDEGSTPAGHIDIEPGFPVESTSSLKVDGEIPEKTIWQERGFYFGGVHTVFENEEGDLEGVADARRVGAVRRFDP